MLGFGSLVQWPPHYVGRGDSREEDGFSEQHPFWRWGTEFSWQMTYCFHSVSPPFPFILCHRSTITKETFVLITSVVHVKMRPFIVFDLFRTTLRPGLRLQTTPNVNDLYDISLTVYSVLFTSKDKRWVVCTVESLFLFEHREQMYDMVHTVIRWSPENHHQPDTSQGNRTSYKTGIQRHLCTADYDRERARERWRWG